MANFVRSGALAVIVVTFLSIMIFKSSGWISWATNNDPLSNKIKPLAPRAYSNNFKKYSKTNGKEQSKTHDIRNFLKPPNPYLAVSNADKKFSQAHQDETVYKILNMDRGFFVEIGAFNGVLFSNTLWFERRHNWTGLLIEANPDLCNQVDRVKRMAWRLCACISKEYDSVFMKGGALGGVEDELNKVIASGLKKKRIKVPCFTLYKALAIIGLSKIDYFSLDVEGAELIILDSMKDDLKNGRITVKVWTIEYRIYDGHRVIKSESVTKLNNIRSFFKEIGGYSELVQLDIGSTNNAKGKKDGDFLDVVFVKNELYREYCKRDSSICNSGIKEHSKKAKDQSATGDKNHNITKFLKPPNPYVAVSNADKNFSQAHQDETVYKILNMDGGFFVEIGAFSGVLFSNTLWFERKHNWTGLLIEANPDLCNQVDRVKRMAWRLCACISKEHDSVFMKGGALGGVEDELNKVAASTIKRQGHIKVPCFMLYEALDVIGVHKIDYFSLDVEGAELLILESMKGDLKTGRITVKVWTIEYRIYDGHRAIKSESITKLNNIRSFFKEIGGYFELVQLDNRPTKKTKDKKDGDFLDVVFVKDELYREYCTRDNNICKNGILQRSRK